MGSGPRVDIPNNMPKHQDTHIAPSPIKVVEVREVTNANHVERGKVKVKAKADEPLICNLCVAMPWRNQTVFATVSDLEKHKSSEHDQWNQLEFNMVTDDPNSFKCPGCEEMFNDLVTCKSHCWKDCPEKERFTSLKIAYDSLLPESSKYATQHQDAGLEEDFFGKEIKAPRYAAKLAADMHRDFTSNPDALERWAENTGCATEDLTLGVPLAYIQQALGRLAGLVAGQPYPIPPVQALDDVPEYTLPDLSTFTALGPDFLEETVERMRAELQADMEMSPSDFESSDESENE